MLEFLKNIPYLSILIFFPLVGVILIMLVPRKSEKSVKYIATVFSLIEFIVSVPLFVLWRGDFTDWMFVEKYLWIYKYDIKYYIGVDGVSMLLVVLTTFLTFIAIVSSYTAIKKKEKEYYIALLFLETGMIGVFVSLDLFLFYIFWEVMLIPMFLLIGIWGGQNRLYAAFKFFIYTAFGSLLMLVAILALVFYYKEMKGAITFEIDKLYTLDIPITYQKWMFLAFALSFAIKVPMYPVHTWLPDAHTEAPTAGSIILAGVLLKMGTYGFFRFAMPLFPDATKEFIPVLAFLALIGITYGALVSMMQKDVKRLVAYSSVAHLGFVMLGLFSLTIQGVQGSIIQMINHGISTGALFLLVGMIYERRHTREISEYGGIASVMPVFATFFMITMLSSVGLPGLNGFVGEFLILIGAFKSPLIPKFISVIAVTGVIFAAGYLLWMYQRVFFGKVVKEENKKLKDLNKREIFLASLLVIFMVWIGLYPKTYLSKTILPTVKFIEKIDKNLGKEAKKELEVKVSKGIDNKQKAE